MPKHATAATAATASPRTYLKINSFDGQYSDFSELLNKFYQLDLRQKIRFQILNINANNINATMKVGIIRKFSQDIFKTTQFETEMLQLKFQFNLENDTVALVAFR